MGNVSTNVYAKFRRAPLRIKKALGIFEVEPGRTNNNYNYSGFLGPAFRVQKFSKIRL